MPKSKSNLKLRFTSDGWCKIKHKSWKWVHIRNGFCNISIFHLLAMPRWCPGCQDKGVPSLRRTNVPGDGVAGAGGGPGAGPGARPVPGHQVRPPRQARRGPQVSLEWIYCCGHIYIIYYYYLYSGCSTCLVRPGPIWLSPVQPTPR